MAGRRIAVLLLAALVSVSCTHGARTKASRAPAPRGSGPAVVGPTVDLLPHQTGGCPSHPRVGRDGTVQPPAQPAHAARMAPPVSPVAVTICRYDAATAKLTGSRGVTSGLDAVAADLAWLPLHVAGATYACAAVLRPHFGYLLLLRYPDGELWISGDTDSCSGTTNGTVSSDFSAGRDIERAYATGAWVDGYGMDGANACFRPPTARLGQEHELVPGTPTSLTLCPPRGRAVRTTDFARLVRLLNGRRTSPTSSSCQPDNEDDVTAYEARFSYSEGPAVVVSINRNCEPKLSNRSLDANDNGAAWREADRLYRAG